mgnify:CR=1 FL=1
MKKIYLIKKSAYDRGTYKIQGGGVWNGSIIWDNQKNGVVEDLKKEGFTVYENEFYYDKDFKEKQKFIKI